MKAQWLRSQRCSRARLWGERLANARIDSIQSPARPSPTSIANSPTYTQGAITKVEPLYHHPGVYDAPKYPVRAYRPSQHVAGAALYIPAPANTSPAYLERALSCHVAGTNGAHSQYASDPLRVDGVSNVDVRSEGSMLRIDVRAKDRASGEQVLQAARGLQSSVSIRQVASAQIGDSF